MINGYIGNIPFAFLDGNVQWEQPEYQEITKPWERGRAFHRMSSRTPIISLVGEQDFTFLGERQNQMLAYVNFVGAIVQIRIRESHGFFLYPGFWKILRVMDVTGQTVVAIGAGGLQGGEFCLTTQWDLARIDIQYT